MVQSVQVYQPAGFRLDIRGTARGVSIVLLRTLQQAMLLLRNPSEGFWQLKQGVHPGSVIVLLTLAFLTRVIGLQITSFHYSTIDPQETNLFLEGFRIFLPWVSWVVAHYAVAVIWYGEGSFADVVAGAAYSLTPYILLGIPLAIMSNILSLDESAIYNGLNTVSMGYMLFLFLWGVRTLHDFDMKQTLIVSALSVFGMIILWATLALIYILTNQIVEFLREFVYEILTR